MSTAKVPDEERGYKPRKGRPMRYTLDEDGWQVRTVSETLWFVDGELQCNFELTFKNHLTPKSFPVRLDGPAESHHTVDVTLTTFISSTANAPNEERIEFELPYRAVGPLIKLFALVARRARENGLLPNET